VGESSSEPLLKSLGLAIPFQAASGDDRSWRNVRVQPRTAFWRISLVREVDVQIVGRRDLLSVRVLHRVLALLGCEPLLAGSDLAQPH
jgi:hypothetical protein